MNKNQIIIFAGAAVLATGLFISLNRPKPQAPVQVEAAPVEEPECQVSPQSLNPLINVKSPEVAKVIEDGYSTELKLYIQHVVLKDNTHLEYSEGGCVHFSFEISYSPYIAAQDSTHLIANDALRELKRPLFHASDKIQILVKALEKVLAEKDTNVPEELSLECGDANCSVTVVDNKLIITYDMPL